MVEETYFDHVVVANGHYSTPNIPDFEWLDKFKGRVVHSHEFRDGAEYKGQNVIVIGSSLSAEDLASQLYKFGANKIILSHRKKTPIFESWPKGIEERPMIAEVDGKTVKFGNGDQGEYDAILLCTGYKNRYAFLDDSLTLEAKNDFWLNNLGNGVMS